MCHYVLMCMWTILLQIFEGSKFFAFMDNVYAMKILVIEIQFVLS